MEPQFREQTQTEQNHPATTLLPETAWATEPTPDGTPPEHSVVVTISRQFGSGGSDIAHLVAKNAGLNYIDQAIIDEVAQRSGIDARFAASSDEQASGIASHILEAIQASNPFTMNYNTLFHTNLSRRQSRDLAYLHLTQRVIMDLASRGNAVIVGRGSQFLLHNAPRTLHIFIFSPLPYRIEYVMKTYQLDRGQAELLIEQRDYEQDTYLRRYYGSDGHQSSLYHLLINTSLFSFDLAAEFICRAIPVIKETHEMR